METLGILVLIFLAIFYLLPILMRWIGPFLLRKTMNYLMKKATGGAAGNQTSYQRSPEGEITLDPKTRQANHNPKRKTGGEYVDFEELS